MHGPLECESQYDAKEDESVSEFDGILWSESAYKMTYETGTNLTITCLRLIPDQRSSTVNELKRAAQGEQPHNRLLRLGPLRGDGSIAHPERGR
eukprot:3997158-Pleurochrysis_carterae.AAC.7